MASFPPTKDQMELIREGVEEIIPEEELERKLETSQKEGVPLLVKQGFDPTRPDLHIGHAVSLRKLRTFQDLGHQVVFVVGDFTALVGDPSGASQTRPALTEAEVKENMKTYQEQVLAILDGERIRIERNSSWLSKLKLIDILGLTSRYTVARMLERDDFRQRYESEQPISIVEFMYPLMQGYDSVALEADIELGGTDQKFNLLIARTLQERYDQEPQVCITLPLLRGTDGAKKMSKSYDNYIGITEPPEEIYGKTMSIPDELLEEWYRLASTLRGQDLKDAIALAPKDPMAAKRALARDLVAEYHGPEAVDGAEAHFDRVVRRHERPQEVPKVLIESDEAEMWLPHIMVETGLAKSSSEAVRLIEQGAVHVDGETVEDRDTRLATKGSYVIRRGKRRYAEVLFD